MGTTYKSNHLKQVIYRLDFTEVDLADFDNFQQQTKNKDLYNYNLDTQSVGNFTFDAATQEISQIQEEVSVWRVEDKQQNMRFEATKDHCLLEYTQYINSTELRKDIEAFVLPFLKVHSIKEASRAGLRYVNQIALPSVKKIADWSKYITNDLLTGSAFMQNRVGAPLRYLNQIELNSTLNSLVSVNFKYGIWNDKYPSPITSAEYILDIDCFTRTPILVDDDMETIYNDLNKTAEMVFEEAIQETLRKEMSK